MNHLWSKQDSTPALPLLPKSKLGSSSDLPSTLSGLSVMVSTALNKKPNTFKPNFVLSSMYVILTIYWFEVEVMLKIGRS